MADADGVAVGRRARDALDAEAAAGAGHILHDDRLAERHLHALGQDAADAYPAARPGWSARSVVMGRDG